MKTCLIIPCYNEAERLQFSDFVNALQDDQGLYFVFVNDGSKDHTSDVLKAFYHEQPSQLKERICILSYNNNKGKSNAVRIGLNWAYQQSFKQSNESKFDESIEVLGGLNVMVDYYGFWDADLATPFGELAWFYQFAASTSPSPSLVIGSRVARLGANIERTIFRHYSGRIFATLISQGLGWKVHDTQCGAKIFQPHLIPICFKEPFKTSWLFDVEMLLRLQLHYGKASESMVLEVPIRQWRDVKGSKIGWGDFIKVPYQIWQVFQSYKKR